MLQVFSTTRFSQLMSEGIIPGKHSVPFFKATVPSLKGKVDGNQQQLLFHVRIKNDECIMSTRRYVVNSELPFKAVNRIFE